MTSETRLGYFRHPTTPAKAKAYLGWMGIAYVATFSLEVAGFSRLGMAALVSTGIVDLWLFFSGQIRTTLPLGIPLCVVAMAGLILNYYLIR